VLTHDELAMKLVCELSEDNKDGIELVMLLYETKKFLEWSISAEHTNRDIIIFWLERGAKFIPEYMDKERISLLLQSYKGNTTILYKLIKVILLIVLI